jgi:hypothetical protein
MAQLQATTVDGVLNSLRPDNITTTSKDIQLADRDKVVACNNTSAITITVPADSTVNFPIGSVVYIARVNTGAVTLAAAGGVTLTRFGTLANNEELYVRKRAANSWITVDQPQSASGTGGTLAASGGYNNHTYSTAGSFTFIVA